MGDSVLANLRGQIDQVIGYLQPVHDDLVQQHDVILSDSKSVQQLLSGSVRKVDQELDQSLTSTISVVQDAIDKIDTAVDQLSLYLFTHL